MRSQLKHINYLALLLSGLLLFAYSYKATHEVFTLEHEVKHICNDRHESENHIHDYHEHHECSVCTFSFSVFQFKNWDFKLTEKHIATPKSTYPIYVFADHSFTNPFPALRGPPRI
jgi:hypothetical protein